MNQEVGHNRSRHDRGAAYRTNLDMNQEVAPNRSRFNNGSRNNLGFEERRGEGRGRCQLYRGEGGGEVAVAVSVAVDPTPSAAPSLRRQCSPRAAGSSPPNATGPARVQPCGLRSRRQTYPRCRLTASARAAACSLRPSRQHPRLPQRPSIYRVAWNGLRSMSLMERCWASNAWNGPNHGGFQT